MLENRPELFEDLQIVYGAFLELHDCRQIGLEPSPISFTEIDRWLDANSIIDLEERQDMYRLIKVCDREWLAKNRQANDRELGKK